MTAKGKMNLLLIVFGVVAICVVTFTLGFIMKNMLGDSIEQNVRSDLKGFTEKQNAYNYAFSKINEQLLNTVEIHFKVRGGLTVTDQTQTLGNIQTKIWKFGNNVLNQDNALMETLAAAAAPTPFLQAKGSHKPAPPRDTLAQPTARFPVHAAPPSSFASAVQET